MIRKSQLSIITILSVLLALSLTIVSFCGAFLPVTYEREVPSLATQGIGQDLVDLFLVVPLLVNPVHVIDIAIALPGLILAALLVMKKKALGFILSLTGLAFTVILAIALAAMMVMLKIKGISEDSPVAVVFVILAILSGMILFLFLKKLNVVERS